jgi:hypothetical protein
LRAFARAALLAAALAAGCTALDPYATFPLPAKPEVVDPGPRVAICYNSFKTPPERVQELAQAECLGDTAAQLVDTDYRVDACPLVEPARATFICMPRHPGHPAPK